MERAQGTIEYLTIIAIVVIISLIVVGVLSSNSPTEQVNSSIEKLGGSTSSINIKEAISDTNGDAIITFQNNTGENFTLTKIVSGEGEDTSVRNYLIDVVSGDSINIALNELRNSCKCTAKEMDKKCTFKFYLTSASGLQKTQTIERTVDCVLDTQAKVSVLPPLSPPEEDDENSNYLGGIVAISSDGNYLAKIVKQYSTDPSFSNVIVSRTLYISNDFGNTWSQKLSDRNTFFTSVAISSTGQYITAVEGGNGHTSYSAGMFLGGPRLEVYSTGYIYTSSDYGNSWTARMTDANRYLMGVAVSSDGRYQTATYNAINGSPTNGSVKVILVSSDFGVTWALKGATSIYFNPASVAMSSSGEVQIEGDSVGSEIALSTDYGNTWTQRTLGGYAGSMRVAISSDGNKIIAAGNGTRIYISTNRGASWTPSNSLNYWAAVAVSSDGTKFIAALNKGSIYESTDNGANWTPTGDSREWMDLAVSANTNIRIAADKYNIYLSNDSGASWENSVSGRVWSATAMSSDGTIQIAALDGGKIYLSTDSGLTWNAKATEKNWSSIAMSSDGKYIVAGVKLLQIYLNSKYSFYNGPIFVSNDYGNTWTRKLFDLNRYANSVAISADGKYVYAGLSGDTISGDGLFRSSDYGATWSKVSGGLFGVSVTPDGSKVVSLGPSIVSYPNGTDQVCNSNDFGQSFNCKSAFLSESYNPWFSVAWAPTTMTSDGLIQIAPYFSAWASDVTPVGGGARISIDGGNTWDALIGLSTGAIITGDGSKLINFIGQISVDGGSTWANSTSTKSFTSIAMSGDGSKILAGVDNGELQISWDGGNTWTRRRI